MLQNWHLRSRSHHCAQTEKPFTDGDPMYTAIYFDPETGGYLRRDVAIDAWQAEQAERSAYSYWKTTFVKPTSEEKPEIASKESAHSLLQRLVEEDEPVTENARYILAVMLERKKQLTETDVKETENGKMRFYENKKTGDVYVIRDPELQLDEIEAVQEDVAMRLGFGGPAAEAARVAGVTLGPDGKVVRAAEPETVPEAEQAEAKVESDGSQEGAPEAAAEKGA